MLDLNKSWKIELSNKKRSLTQYVEASDSDEAIKKAKDTFYARLTKLDENCQTVLFQKACDKTIATSPLEFGFCGGWVTVYPSGDDTIYSMVKKAVLKIKSVFNKDEQITEITSRLN